MLPLRLPLPIPLMPESREKKLLPECRLAAFSLDKDDVRSFFQPPGTPPLSCHVLSSLLVSRSSPTPGCSPDAGPSFQRHCALDHVGTTARIRKVPDVQVDVSEKSVVTLVCVFGVIRI